MMSDERKKVLELLAAGKVTADEAERLIERLDAGGRTQEQGHGWSRRHRLRGAGETAALGAPAAEAGEAPRPLPRYLRVLVAGADGETVNIRVPLKLVRTGIKLGAMLPKDAKAKIEAKGISLEGFSGMAADELVEALEELSVDVEDGKETVRIFCE